VRLSRVVGNYSHSVYLSISDVTGAFNFSGGGGCSYLSRLFCAAVFRLIRGVIGACRHLSELPFARGRQGPFDVVVRSDLAVYHCVFVCQGVVHVFIAFDSDSSGKSRSIFPPMTITGLAANKDSSLAGSPLAS